MPRHGRSGRRRRTPARARYEEKAEEGGPKPAARPWPSGAPRRTKASWSSFGSGVGYFINTLLASARQSIKLMLNTIMPFMAYVVLLIGIVTYTGVAEWIGKLVRPLVSNPIGLVVSVSSWHCRSCRPSSGPAPRSPRSSAC